jgi:hypothetical protein
VLDLHDLGAQAPQELGGERQGLHLFCREHAHTVEWFSERECGFVGYVAELHGDTVRVRPEVAAEGPERRLPF